jgi:hypothetical protein
MLQAMKCIVLQSNHLTSHTAPKRFLPREAVSKAELPQTTGVSLTQPLVWLRDCWEAMEGSLLMQRHMPSFPLAFWASSLLHILLLQSIELTFRGSLLKAIFLFH